MNLFNRITHLRGHAAFLYDLSKKQNKSPEEIGRLIKPLVDGLAKEVQQASIKAKVQAIQALEGQIEAMIKEIETTHQRMEDVGSYVQMLKSALKEQMGEAGFIEEEGYIVTNVDGKIQIR